LEPATTGFRTRGNGPGSEKLVLIHAREGDGYLRPPERGRNRWFNAHDFSTSSFLLPPAR
jgi:hypothetical protein